MARLIRIATFPLVMSIIVIDYFLKGSLTASLVLTVWVLIHSLTGAPFNNFWLYMALIGGAASVRVWNALFRKLGRTTLLVLWLIPYVPGWRDARPDLWT